MTIVTDDVSEQRKINVVPQIQSENLLSGRVLIATGEEFICSSRNVTVSSAEVLLAIDIAVGQTVVCYFDGIGLLPGKVSARTQEGFSVAFSIKLSRRNRLAEQLEWQSNQAAEADALLRATCLVPLNRNVEVRLGQNIVMNGTINNMSRFGASIRLSGAEIPFTGTRLRVGARYAVVVRLLQEGIAVQFEEPFAANKFDDRVRL